MPYAMRPMGDYKTYGYAGDPGFLSDLWKGVKKVARVAIPIIAPWTAPAFKAYEAGRKPSPPMQLQQGSFPGVGARGPASPGWWGQAAGPQPFSATPGVPRLPPSAMPQQTCPSGYHYAKDGSGRLVRNRRMNVANPRALRRSMRRVQGFEKLAKRTIQFTRRVRMKKRKTT